MHFHCPGTGCREDAYPVHDTRERVWRHPDFFQYKAFIHAGLPRVTCPVHGVRTVSAPWTGPGSGFTLLFEARAVEMARHLPAGTLAGQVDETDTRLRRSVARYVDEARRLEDHTGAEAVGIDETGRKGHDCITVVADLVEHDATDVAPGKDPATVERFARNFMDHDGGPEYVRPAACDMSLGFPEGHPRASAPCAADRRLLRAPVPTPCPGRRQRHPEREETGPRLPQHGLLRHHDLPGLRQTRPQSRHHHLTITHHKQRIALLLLAWKDKSSMQ